MGTANGTVCLLKLSKTTLDVPDVKYKIIPNRCFPHSQNGTTLPFPCVGSIATC